MSAIVNACLAFCSTISTALPDFLRRKIFPKISSITNGETIVGPPATTSHVECSKEERQAMGIPESLIRYSTGIEDIRDLVDDMDNALAKLK